MGMSDVLQVTCPCCDTILIVERKTGAIVEERKPILNQSTGDRYEDALQKVRQRPAEAQAKFSKFHDEQDARKARLSALFDERLKEINESGEEVEKVNPFEMD